MAAQTRPRIERHIAKGFRRRRVDHFPNVNVHTQAELFEFVHQGDVHAPENIFKQLRHFGRARRTHRHDAGHHLRVQRLRRAPTRRIQSANHFWNLRQPKLFVSWIFALRRKRQVKIARNILVFLACRDGTSQTAFLQDRKNHFFGGPRIGRALQNDQLSRP